MDTHDNHPILIVSGTNRPNSSTLKVARVVERHYHDLGVPAALYNLTDLPAEVFTPEAYAAKPAAFLPVQQRVLDAAGLHVVTPEYNGSFPGVLKYFVDMLKFPESFERKPVAFVGVASGTWGALRAVEQLQLVFGYRNAHVYPDRVFVPAITAKLAPDGALTDAQLNERLARQAGGFAEFARSFARRQPG
jgi:NAD(P)H-dependent FMN reductase